MIRIRGVVDLLLEHVTELQDDEDWTEVDAVGFTVDHSGPELDFDGEPLEEEDD